MTDATVRPRAEVIALYERAAAALRHSAESPADLSWPPDHAGLEDGAVAVIATDLDGTIRLWNRAAERLYGWPAAGVLGRPITEVTVGPDDGDAAQSIMA